MDFDRKITRKARRTIEVGSFVSLGSWRELGWPEETNPKRLWSGPCTKMRRKALVFLSKKSIKT